MKRALKHYFREIKMLFTIAKLYLFRRNPGLRLEIFRLIKSDLVHGSHNFFSQKALTDFIVPYLNLKDINKIVDIADQITRIYPMDFHRPNCLCCGSRKVEAEYVGTKTLPANIYPAAPEFPLFSRGTLPLIYGTCRNCGFGQILFQPKPFWIDVTIDDKDRYGQWMDDPKYVAEKTAHSHTHYKKCNLEKFKENNSVIEISSGNGIFLNLLRTEYGWNRLVIGLEPDPAAVQSAKKKFDLNIKNKLVYFERSTYDIDLAILDNALEHHSSPRLALEALWNIVRHDGGLFIVVPNYHSYAVEKLGVDYFNMNWGHWVYFTAQSLVKMVLTAGFSVEQVYSSFYEPSLGKEIPVDVEVEIPPHIVANTPPQEKIMRGEFLYLVARKAQRQDLENAQKCL